MKQKFKVVAVGNVEPAMYHLLTEKGYEVRTEKHEWIVENNEVKFVAENILELAGLVWLFEQKGENWKANDQVMDEFIRKHP